MSVQKRPLSGMVQPSGVALPVAIPQGPARAVLHTLGSVGTQQGGPFVDRISVWVSNSDVANDHLASLAFFNPTSILAEVLVPKGSTVEVLVDVPFASARDAVPATLEASADAAGVLTAWGWFARPL